MGNDSGFKGEEQKVGRMMKKAESKGVSRKMFKVIQESVEKLYCSRM